MLGLIPTLLLLVSAAGVVCLLIPPVRDFMLYELGIPQWGWLTFAGVTFGFVLLLYALTFISVDRGRLTMRSLRGKSGVNLRRLDYAELISLGGRKGGIVVRLEDLDGGEVYLPLGPWRDEDLLVAIILRAAVARKVKIEGDAEVVEVFTALKQSYRPREGQQAA